jgi:hypothetical protein
LIAAVALTAAITIVPVPGNDKNEMTYFAAVEQLQAAK